jgi:metal-responsive CopG/Arc/MetJ family transcriptional regulator
MASDMISTRLGEGLRKQVDAFSKTHAESQSKIIRKAVSSYIDKELEKDELREMVSLKYAQQKISFEELVRILGYEDAKQVAFLVDVAEKSLKEGL